MPSEHYEAAAEMLRNNTAAATQKGLQDVFPGMARETAVALLDELEAGGVIGPAVAGKSREVIDRPSGSTETPYDDHTQAERDEMAHDAVKASSPPADQVGDDESDPGASDDADADEDAPEEEDEEDDDAPEEPEDEDEPPEPVLASAPEPEDKTRIAASPLTCAFGEEIPAGMGYVDATAGPVCLTHSSESLPV